MKENEISVLGYSGHSYVVCDIAISEGMNLKYYSNPILTKKNPYNLNYIGSESNHDFFKKNDCNYVLGIGDNKIREKVYNFFKNKNKKILNVIDSSSMISKNVKIGDGNFISKNVIINSLVKIESACIINSGAIVEHECKISCFTHIGPGAVVCGNVKVGQRVFIGAGAVIRQGVNIGDDVVIGAGSIVLHNISDGKRIVGNPAKEI